MHNGDKDNNNNIHTSHFHETAVYEDSNDI